MRKVEIKIYTFSELSEEAKKRAIQKERESQDFSYIYEDVKETIKEFCAIFNFSVITRNSIFDPIIDVPFDVSNLNGERLKTYIYNNYGDTLFRGKTYSKLVDTEKDGTKIAKSKTHPAGLRLVSRKSKVLKSNCCVLTGVCYDDDMLSVFYDFLKGVKYQDLNLEELIEQAFYNLESSVNNEIEYRQSDEGIEEELTERDEEFTENGKRI